MHHAVIPMASKSGEVAPGVDAAAALEYVPDIND
jgi:hypothetical protein